MYWIMRANAFPVKKQKKTSKFHCSQWYAPPSCIEIFWKNVSFVFGKKRYSHFDKVNGYNYENERMGFCFTYMQNIFQNILYKKNCFKAW